MMPIVRTAEFELPVVGRSYSPAFFGWFPVMCHSFTRDEMLFYALSTLAFCAYRAGCSATGHRYCCNSKAILVPDFLFLLQKSLLSLFIEGRYTWALRENILGAYL